MCVLTVSGLRRRRSAISAFVPPLRSSSSTRCSAGVRDLGVRRAPSVPSWHWVTLAPASCEFHHPTPADRETDHPCGSAIDRAGAGDRYVGNFRPAVGQSHIGASRGALAGFTGPRSTRKFVLQFRQVSPASPTARRPGCEPRSRSTSERSGIASCAPRLVTTSAPTAAAKRNGAVQRLSLGERYRERAGESVSGGDGIDRVDLEGRDVPGAIIRCVHDALLAKLHDRRPGASRAEDPRRLVARSRCRRRSRRSAPRPRTGSGRRCRRRRRPSSGSFEGGAGS